jgi:hypothetical protein
MAPTSRLRVRPPLTAAAKATEAVARVRDDPLGRLALSAHFYDPQPGRVSIRPYRHAEMTFMRWQIRRGLLAPPTAKRPGSPWWRAVNEHLLRDTCEADAISRGRPGSPTRSGVEHWLRFLDRPTPSNWYRAHNSSIVAGYLAHRDLALDELPAERFFMDVALVRVLYAHALVVAPRLALGQLSPIGRLLGDPRRRMADLFLSLQNILPDSYPLDDVDIDQMIREEHRLGRMLDYAVIAPRLQALYEHAAEELQEPRLLDFIRNRAPIYAWPYEKRHVWTTPTPPLSARLLTWATKKGET